jgi:hypothetical protein
MYCSTSVVTSMVAGLPSIQSGWLAGWLADWLTCHVVLPSHSNITLCLKQTAGYPADATWLEFRRLQQLL